MPNPQITQPSGACINGAWVPSPASLALPVGDGNWLTVDGGLAPSIVYPTPAVGARTLTFVPTAGDKVIYNVTINDAATPQPCGPQYGPDQTLLDSTKPAVAADTDAAAVELGVKFTPARNGRVTAIRYYQGSSTEKVTKANLYDANGKVIASATVTSSTTIGWKSVAIPSTTVTGGQAYTASYVTSNGRYPATANGFSAAKTVGDLSTAANAGVYKYGGGFPTSTYQACNYFADVVFNALSGAPVVTPPTDGGGTTPPPSGGGGTTTPPVDGGGTTTPPVTSGLLGWTRNETNTGLAGVGITDTSKFPKYTGPQKLAPGTYKNILFTGLVDLSAGNITIDQCRIAPAGGYQGLPVAFTYNIDTAGSVNAKNITIRDSDIDGTGVTASQAAFMTGFMGAANLLRNKVHGFGSGIAIIHSDGAGDLTLEGNYVYGLIGYGDGSTDAGNHSDGFTIRDYSAGKLTMNANRIVTDGGNETGSCFLQALNGLISNVWLTNNLFGGKGYNMGLEAKSAGYSNINADNNRFDVQGFGPVYKTGGPGAATWTNNYRYDASKTDARGDSVGAP